MSPELGIALLCLALVFLAWAARRTHRPTRRIEQRFSKDALRDNARIASRMLAHVHRHDR